MYLNGCIQEQEVGPVRVVAPPKVNPRVKTESSYPVVHTILIAGSPYGLGLKWAGGPTFAGRTEIVGAWFFFRGHRIELFCSNFKEVFTTYDPKKGLASKQWVLKDLKMFKVNFFRGREHTGYLLARDEDHARSTALRKMSFISGASRLALQRSLKDNPQDLHVQEVSAL